MPFPIRSFGTKLLRLARHADLQFARHLREQMLGTEDRLKGVAERVIEDLYHPYPLRPIDPVRRRSRQRMYFSWFRTPIVDLYENLARRGSKQMDKGYLLGARQFRALIARLYPKRYVPRLSEGWAMDGPETLLEVIEGLSEDGIVRLMAADAIQFSFGTGEIRQGLKDFVDKQLQRGVEPGSLIRTMTSEHVGKIRESVGQMMDQAQSLNWAKNEALKKITGRVADPAVRTALEHNVMRIVRTAHMQGINSDMLAFGSANRDIVAYLERKADGRPCVACTYPNSLVLTQYGSKRIDEIEEGEMVATHSGEFREVTETMSRWYEGDMIDIEVDGNNLSLTPEHLVLTVKGWIPAGELAVGERVCVHV